MNGPDLSVATAKSKPAAKRWPIHARDGAIAFSIANLTFLRIWADLLYYREYVTFTMKQPPRPVLLHAAAADVVLLGLSLWGVMILMRRYMDAKRPRTIRSLFVLQLFFPLNACFQVFLAYFHFTAPLPLRPGPRITALIIVVSLSLLLLAACRWPKAVAKYSSNAFLIFAPLTVITVGTAIANSFKPVPAEYADKPAALRLHNPDPRPHVVWIILDEWDYRLSFEKRDPSVAMPELDRLRQTSIFGQRVYPAGGDTLHAVPSLITGTRWPNAELWSPVGLRLSAGSAPPSEFTALPNVFTRVRAMEMDTSVAGWYLPYGRIVASAVSSCFWLPIDSLRNSLGAATLWTAMRDEVRSLFETSWFSVFGQSLETERHARLYATFLNRAKHDIEQQYNLTFLHLCVPHAPFFYDRKTHSNTRKNSVAKGYLDALELADQTVGELRRTMEAAGIWDDTTVLLSSDHYMRMAVYVDGGFDVRIPFLLKLAHQKKNVEYTQPFNAVCSEGLIRAILQKQVQTPEDAVSWLDRNAPRSPVDLYQKATR